jgi:mono/diheme cytochrome c family protein
MKKSNLVIFGLFAALFVVVIPFWAIGKEGGSDASPARVAESDEPSKALFATNCGACHTLARGGTQGVVGPDLDEALGSATPEANRDRVLSAIENGVAGRMPAGILSGAQAEQAADFVARVAGK